MTRHRRAFLRRAAALCSLATLLAAGCGGGTKEADAVQGGGGPVGKAPTMETALVAGPGATVRLAAAASPRPVAYLSRSRRRVWVERSLRDRVHRLLGAHISVSTGLWRIPLPGDDPRVPIPPGDGPREYLEVEMERWDPSMEPGSGDVRIVRGAATTVRVSPGCAPVLGGGVVQVDPFDLSTGRAGGEELIREDFSPVARGRRHRDPACLDEGEPVQVLGWSARDGSR